MKLGAKRSLFSGLHIILFVLLGDVGLHGVPRGAEPLAVGAAEPTGAQVLRFHVILLMTKMVSTQITCSKFFENREILVAKTLFGIQYTSVDAGGVSEYSCKQEPK